MGVAPVGLVSGQLGAATQCDIDFERRRIRRAGRYVLDAFGYPIRQCAVGKPFAQNGFGIVGGDNRTGVDFLPGLQLDAHGAVPLHHDTADGRVEVNRGSVSQLSFQEDTFDLVTAVETHFWWPNLPTDMREVFRVLKTGGKLIVIAEVYKGANTTVAKLAEKYASQAGMKMLDVDQHRELFAQAGYSDVQVVTEPDKGWICGIGRKP